jgi:hypothetical protein
MRFTTFARTLCAAFATVATLSATPSGAAVYSSVFDPVDFHGVATFDVSDACLAAGPGLVANAGSCTVTWLSALVTLIDAPNQVSFDYAPAFLPSASAVSSIFVQAGELAGVNSSVIGPALVFASPDPDLNGPWWIEFLFGPLGEFAHGIVNLYHGNCVMDVTTPICTRDPLPTSVADVESFTRLSVPEPATLLLLAIAAAVLVPAARGRRGGSS